MRAQTARSATGWTFRAWLFFHLSGPQFSHLPNRNRSGADAKIEEYLGPAHTQVAAPSAPRWAPAGQQVRGIQTALTQVRGLGEQQA